MPDSKRAGTFEQLTDPAKIPNSTEAVDEDPFSNERINDQIRSEVSRIASAWLASNSDPEEGSFDDRIVETLVGTLDAHAKVLLTTVDRETRLSQYLKHVRQVGAVLIENAMKNSVLKDPYASAELPSAESLRKDTALALIGLGHGAPSTVRRDSRPGSGRVHRGPERCTDPAELATHMERHARWREWRNQLLNRIELLFEARYRHWEGEARDRVRQKSTTTGDKRRGPVGTARWEDVKIEFLSDERVQIWRGNQTETRNYGEMGFMDRRTGKPNQSWAILDTWRRQAGPSRIQHAAEKTGLRWRSTYNESGKRSGSLSISTMIRSLM